MNKNNETINIYYINNCNYCSKITNLIKDNKYKFNLIKVYDDDKDNIKLRNKFYTFPQINILIKINQNF